MRGKHKILMSKIFPALSSGKAELFIVFRICDSRSQTMLLPQFPSNKFYFAKCKTNINSWLSTWNIKMHSIFCSHFHSCFLSLICIFFCKIPLIQYILSLQNNQVSLQIYHYACLGPLHKRRWFHGLQRDLRGKAKQVKMEKWQKFSFGRKYKEL